MTVKLRVTGRRHVDAASGRRGITRPAASPGRNSRKTLGEQGNMSVINPHRCCPLCGDRNFTEVARTDADPEVGQNEDEALYRCATHGHEFTSNDHVWDVHEDDDRLSLHERAKLYNQGPSYHEIRSREIVETMTTKTVREVEVDPVAGAGYYMVMPSATIVATTERRVNIDWDQDGNLVGIELLDIMPPSQKKES